VLNRDSIVTALRSLGERLAMRGVVGEINLLGGTAMILGFQARQSTKDVNAIFAPAAIIREEAAIVASDLGLSEDWLNDAAKSFVSPKAQFAVLADLEFQNLRVQVPTAEYLLAMKVMAARVALGQTPGDKGGHPVPHSPPGIVRRWASHGHC
jgi:hypothetical protein